MKLFLEDIQIQLLHQGFQELTLKKQGIYGFFKKQADTNYCTVFINMPSELPENPWIIRYEEKLIKDNILLEGDTKFLFVYITNETDKIRCLCEDNADGHWIVDPITKQLIIFENQISNFCGLKDAIESTLSNGEEKTGYVPSYTLGIILINILIFVFTFMICNLQQREILFEKGGMFWPAITVGKEFYRFITSMFLHFGFEHLANNLFLFFIIGSYVEEHIGHTKFVFLYFVSGILAGVVSMGYNMFRNKFILCAGASGAIFGVVGALACLVIFSKVVRKDITGPRLLFFLAIIFFSSFQEKNVDNMAHLGGLLSGFLYMLAIMIIDRRVKRLARERV